MALVNSTRRRFLSVEELTPAFLAGVLPEPQGAPNHREVLDFVGLRQYEWNSDFPQGAILRRHRVEPKDERAAIVGFADRSIRLGEEEFVTTLLEPFHIKNSKMHGVKSPYYRLGENANTAEIDEAAVVRDTARLDRARLNLVVEAFLAMCNDKQFRYVSGSTDAESDLVITIPYDHEIFDLTDAGAHPDSNNALNGANPETLYEYRQMKAEYRKEYGANPNLIFVNSATAAKILTNADIKAQYTPLSSSDPDRIPQTYDSFMYDGIRHVVWHNTYQTAQGESEPVDDDYGIVTRTESAIDGGPPLRWNRAQTRLNRQDASQPYFQGLMQGDEEPDIGVRMYDNGIPTPADKGIVQKWKMTA